MEQQLDLLKVLIRVMIATAHDEGLDLLQYAHIRAAYNEIFGASKQ